MEVCLMTKIDKFSGKYSFLSNFYVCFPKFILYNGRRFRTVEHAFQAAKCLNEELAKLPQKEKTVKENPEDYAKVLYVKNLIIVKCLINFWVLVTHT